ncbi:hypothetical protein GCM10011575_10050 [Microlunatus endophyticus]|uniref:DUF4232 domain-containing protein n=1 Tax=Microlunatus endophyticus TaxID=1716077 RepID=A0A917W0I4_9ACTN|nr:hypothetical protein GCM10011575_10050 [Microlunatus endophyticus]
MGVAAAAFLAACGNGVEVGGPAAGTSPQGSPTSAASRSADSESASPTAPATTRSATPSKSPSSDAGSGKSEKPGKHRTSQKPDKPGDETSSAPSNSGTDSGGIATCTLGDLDVTVDTPAGAGGAGSQYVLLGFTNTSPDPCAIYGYPGVSFVGHHNGTQLGKPAVRDRSQSPHTVRLAPGATESGLLQIAQAANFDPQKCQPTTSDGFRVYPPGSYTAAYVPFKASACQGKVAQLTVYPVGSKS